MIAQIDDNLTEGEFRLVSELVYRHCGIDLHEGKRDLVRARLAKRVRSSGAASIAEYLESVRSDPTGREFGHLIDAISTNLTSFFRESSHFDHLRQSLVPALVSRRRSDRAGRIRAWSAACSTGEEPYSIAMTLLDALGDAPGWDVKVLATDISRDVLRRARAGAYDGTRLGSVPPALRSKYFRRAPNAGREQGGESGRQPAGAPPFVVSERLRQAVVFNYLNLMDPWPFRGPFDFIFCRNVMIYFDKPTQERLVGRFWEVLAPGGLLFTGHSESLTGVAHRFRYVMPTVYAK
jgi:chemotaxis protein methyltransferase CheR